MTRGRAVALHLLRLGSATPAARSAQMCLSGKDFSAIPVCGSVRPIASQRSLVPR